VKLQLFGFNSATSLRLKPKRRVGAFTLLELLVVMGIIAVLLVAVAPALTSIKGSGDIASAAHTISDALQQARTYAIANNTYVWVGFFEESASQAPANPGIAGIGRVVISTISSKDGTIVYNPNSLKAIDPSRVSQIGKLIRISGIHLATFNDGKGTGENFDTRPPVGSNTARIGDSTPPNPSLTPFQYPVGSSASAPQYTFVKAVEFSPRGEARIDNSNYSYKAVAEVGLQPTHGSTVDTNSRNVVAIQFGGLGGNFKIYRR
jgi:prepilin-type N-terminal cleavage/methylation domain-containing protein